MRIERKILLRVATLCWLVPVAAGVVFFARYEMTPGRPAAAAATWPRSSRMRRAPDRPTLVMFVHPRCSCSRASVAELEHLMVWTGDRVSSRVVFVGDSKGGVETAPLYRQCMRVPGLSIHRDPDGAEAARFGAATSGQVLLYDDGGGLEFTGGITGARGMTGDNLGARWLRESIDIGRGTFARAGRLPGRIDHDTSPVFGCALAASDAASWRLSP